MFGGLTQGSIFYIFNKTNDGVELKKGVIEDIQKNGYQFGKYLQSEPNVDIKVRCGKEVYELQQLPANINITSRNGLVVSDNEESITAEVKATRNVSQKIVDSEDYHKNVVVQCDEILRGIVPELAKEKEQEEKMGALEAKIGALEEKIGNFGGTLTNMQSMLSSALSASTHTKNKKEE